MSYALAPYAGKTADDKKDPLYIFDTPSEPIDALVSVLRARGLLTGRTLWEPCAGNGAISGRLKAAHKLRVACTDVQAAAPHRCDFLTERKFQHPVITNPPWSLWKEFIQRGYELELPWFAYLLPGTKPHVAGSLELPRPAIWMPLTWRIDWTGQGRPKDECSWGLWQPPLGERPTEMILLKKPKEL